MIGGRDGTGAGRTMKEYEDQLEALKKENFNLKLRIYFLEERMGITSADENTIKKNIELKVPIFSICLLSNCWSYFVAYKKFTCLFLFLLINIDRLKLNH